MNIKLKAMQQSNIPYAFYIYDDIKADGYDWWTDETIPSETSANFFRDELAKIPKDAPIALYINSMGGDVKEGLAICNILKRHAGVKTAYIDGFACSMASVVAVSCDNVVMPKNTLMMVHNAWMHACGNPEELRKAASDLEKVNAAAIQNYLLHAGEKLTETDLRAMLNEEKWLSADECIEYGLADEIARYDADIEAARKILTETQKIAEQRSASSPAAAHTEKLAAAALEAIPQKKEESTKEENHVADTFAHLLNAFINN